MIYSTLRQMYDFYSDGMSATDIANSYINDLANKSTRDVLEDTISNANQRFKDAVWVAHQDSHTPAITSLRRCSQGGWESTRLLAAGAIVVRWARLA